jgi:hypothetical protein
MQIEIKITLKITLSSFLLPPSGGVVSTFLHLWNCSSRAPVYRIALVNGKIPIQNTNNSTKEKSKLK